MIEQGLVFIGIDVVADAVDTAEGRRWSRARAPRGLWRRLGVRTGVVLRHPDAPLGIALLPADASFRGLVDTTDGRLGVLPDGEAFDEAVDDIPVIAALVDALEVAHPA